MSKMKLVCDGDSWTFGSEICDPTIMAKHSPKEHITRYDFLPDNDVYRTARIWPTHLGKLLDAEVINLSCPADDNKTIGTRTITYLATNYVLPKQSTEDLLVVIGWSSPERNSFWYDDGKVSNRFRLWPNIAQFEAAGQKAFWQAYVAYMWNRNEYLSRYVQDVINLQSFCDAHGIAWMCFNSFYQTPGQNIDQWKDMSVKDEIALMRHESAQYSKTGENERLRHEYNYQNLWSLVDEKRFYKKDQANNTFKSFVGDKLNGWHPSPEGHELWAEELHRYIVAHDLVRLL